MRRAENGRRRSTAIDVFAKQTAAAEGATKLDLTLGSFASRTVRAMAMPWLFSRRRGGEAVPGYALRANPGYDNTNHDAETRINLSRRP